MASATDFTRAPTVLSTALKGSLPTMLIDPDIDSYHIALACLQHLNNLQQDHLTTDALWKDSLSMTGTMRTFHSSQSIVEAWTALSPQLRPHAFALVPGSSHVFHLGPHPAWITASFTFETEGAQAGVCSGMMNIVPDDQGGYRIWVLSTLLEELKGVGNPDRMPEGPIKAADVDGELGCVVVGAGMAGLCAASRLRALGVEYVVLDRNESVGENWLKRYDSAKLHLSNSYSEMPFRRVYADKPYYLTRMDLAEGLRRFASEHGLNVWLASSIEKASWDGERRVWTLSVSKNGQVHTLKARHLVMATGGGIDKPNVPLYEHRDRYSGTVLHSVDWKNAHAFRGKRGIVIGSANSAFDVAQDMVDAGLLSVTMVQRSTTSRCIPRTLRRRLTNTARRRSSKARTRLLRPSLQPRHGSQYCRSYRHGHAVRRRKADDYSRGVGNASPGSRAIHSRARCRLSILSDA